MKKTVFRFSIPILIFLVVQILAASQNEFNVIVELTKKNYLKSEPVFATISLHNSATFPILIVAEFEIIVKDGSGKQYPHRAPVVVSSTNSWKDTLTLQPRSKHSELYDLTPYFGGGGDLKSEYDTKH